MCHYAMKSVKKESHYHLEDAQTFSGEGNHQDQSPQREQTDDSCSSCNFLAKKKLKQFGGLSLLLMGKRKRNGFIKHSKVDGSR